MAAITWKNVNAPSFSASNQLLESSNRALSDAFASGADILTKEGDRRKGINTDKGIAAMQAIQGLDNSAQERAAIMAGLGSNIDRAAIADAGNNRIKTLQDNAVFADSQTLADQQIGAGAFEADNRQALFDRQQKLDAATLAGKLVGNNVQRQEYNRGIPANMSAAAAAEVEAARVVAEQKQKDAIAMQKLENIGKNKGNGSESRIASLIDNTSNNLGSLTSTTRGQLHAVNSRFNKVPASIREEVIGRNIDESSVHPVNFSNIEEELQIEADKADTVKNAAIALQNNIDGNKVKLKEINKQLKSGIGDKNRLEIDKRTLEAQLKILESQAK